MDVTKKGTLNERLEITARRAKTLVQPFIELFYGIKTRTLPWEWCTGIFVVLALAFTFRVDVWFFRHARLIHIYPTRPWLYWPYFAVLATSGFWGWAAIQTVRRRLLARQLTEAFSCAGLKNRMGKLPSFIFDRPLDGYTRKLKVTSARLPLAEFKRVRESIESALQVYVDDFREQRASGTVEILYSHFPMPEMCNLDEPKRVGAMNFVVGQTRARQLQANYELVPHLLIAGQTNSGKSTFLRQLITTAYLNNESFDFTLIDLKEGLEFQLFENLARVSVVSNLTQASAKLKKFAFLLENRMKLLKANKCKDLQAYRKLPKEKRVSAAASGKQISLNRHLIVIDEAADLFLAGSNAPAGEIQKARRVLVEIARKGRACGLHLVFATQRPDSRSIDAQIKANLPGALCFQMPNDASSIMVLGNGRATDLPPIPGRAIWKSGRDMIEVQTPFLSTETADELLKPHRQESKEKDTDDADLKFESDPARSSSATTQALYFDA